MEERVKTIYIIDPSDYVNNLKRFIHFNLPTFDFYTNRVQYNGILKDLSEKRSVLLMGKAGQGKSYFLEAYNRICIPGTRSGYHIYTAKQIVDFLVTYDLQETPNLPLPQLQIGQRLQYQDIMIDDLGRESLLKHYGTNGEYIMAEFIHMRYKAFKEKGIRTHITTNYNLDKMYQQWVSPHKDLDPKSRIYDRETLSRIKEICNIYTFGETNDYREYRHIHYPVKVVFPEEIKEMHKGEDIKDVFNNYSSIVNKELDIIRNNK